MSKYTTGPWHIIDEGQIFDIRDVEENTVTTVVMVQPSLPENYDKDRANARLIAAAPELLAAAKLALELVHSAAAKDEMVPWTRMVSRFSVLKSAIAKAEGEDK